MTLPAGVAAAFPPEEHEARVGAVRAAMERQGVALLLLASPEDIYYLVGLDHFGYFAVSPLVLALDDPPRVVARGMEGPTVDAQAPGCAFVSYEDPDDPADAVVEALRQAGADGERVGFDGATMFLPPAVLDRVRERLPRATFVDTPGLVAWERAVKSPREIAYVRRAAALSDRALQAGLAAAGEGVAERDIAAAIYAELIAGGSETPAVPALVRSTPTLALEHVTWSDRRLRGGDTLFLELSASIARYHAPLSRFAHVGALPAGIDAAAGPALAALDAACNALRPGVRAGDVYAAWQAAVDAGLGHSRYRRHHCGYLTGIGYPPTWGGPGAPVGLRPGAEWTVREGMVFHMFAWILGQGPVDYGVSDTALVGADGSELLTTTAREPIVIR